MRGRTGVKSFCNSSAAGADRKIDGTSKPVSALLGLDARRVRRRGIGHLEVGEQTLSNACVGLPQSLLLTSAVSIESMGACTLNNGPKFVLIWRSSA